MVSGVVIGYGPADEQLDRRHDVGLLRHRRPRRRTATKPEARHCTARQRAASESKARSRSWNRVSERWHRVTASSRRRGLTGGGGISLLELLLRWLRRPGTP